MIAPSEARHRLRGAQRARVLRRIFAALIVLAAGARDATALQAAYERATVPGPAPPVADLVIRNGLIFDGSGAPPYKGDVAVQGGRIAAIGELGAVIGTTEIDAAGLAVSPGFIDSCSVTYEFYALDRRSLSKVYQGITLEVLGEGDSPAPLSAAMKAAMKARQYQFAIDLPWSTTREYLDYLARQGVGTNYAVYVGASTVRRHVLGDADRAPTATELERMRQLVRESMQDGAVGLTAGLSWSPGSYAQRAELVALASEVAQFDGLFEVVPRTESNGVADAVGEVISIARETGVRTGIPMFKQSGVPNWGDIEPILADIASARAFGVRISATMYPYTWLGTSLSTALPPWAHAGGWDSMLQRLETPVDRERMARDMRAWTGGWEQLLALAGKPENVLFTKLEKPLAHFQGKTLADVMRERQLPAEEAAIALLRENRNEVWGVYQTMSEENLRRQMTLQWMGFSSGDTAAATEGVFLETLLHPRAYGYVARLLGRYVREEGVLTLQEAVRRMTSLPAQSLRIRDRGRLQAGYFADIAVFDPAAVRETGSFESPHHYAAGFRHVFVNGVAVLRNGLHTGALPGVAVTPR